MLDTRDQYVNTKTKMLVRCNNNHELQTTWNKFVTAKSRCKDCNSNNMKVKFEDVKKEFDRLGFTLLETEYTDNRTPMRCICTCGREFSITYSNASHRKDGQCIDCARRWNIVDVEDYMEDNGCKLLSVDSTEFVLNSNKVTYICYCGNQYACLWRSFKEGSRCRECTMESLRDYYMTLYGVDNPSKAPEIKQKIVDTMVKRYGVEYAMQLKEFAIRSSDTNKKNHGGIHNLNIPEIRELSDKAYEDKYGAPFGFVEEHNQKGRQVSKEKYGHEVYIQSEQGKKEMMEKYGAEYFVMTKVFPERILEKYGVLHPMQSPELVDKALKSALSAKKYTFPSGNIVHVQGYEPFAIDLLLSQGILEEDIVIGCKKVPKISYTYEKTRTYFPDFYIKSQDRIIEVKSVYTYTNELEINIEKFRATSIKHDFRLWVFSPKGELIIEGMFVGDMFAHFYQ